LKYCNPGLSGKHQSDALVVLGELAAVLLLGQVEPAVDVATAENRSSQKGVYGGIVRRESG
jgi:hypothetical protein